MLKIHLLALDVECIISSAGGLRGARQTIDSSAAVGVSYAPGAISVARRIRLEPEIRPCASHNRSYWRLLVIIHMSVSMALVR